MTDKTRLIAQLRMLVQLTQSEAQIAETRVAQAATEAVRRELTQNAKNANTRTDLLTKTIRDLGGIPDVVTPAIGRLTAVVKATVEQAEPFDEAVLQDLTLEHQLLDRARYLKVLADAADQPKVVKVAERLIAAHSATVEWLTVVLAEEALGGPAALKATPLQRIAGGATRVAGLPARYATETVNRAVESVQRNAEQGADQAKGALSTAANKATQLTGAVRDVVAGGRNAGLLRAEKIAKRRGDRGAAEALHETRRETGTLEPNELPIRGYDALTIPNAVKAIKGLKNVTDVRAIMAYEQTHANRSSVVSAAQTQVASIAKQAVGVS